MTNAIDLNADLGELPGADGRASDAAVLRYVTSCAIACGGHAGDDTIMEATLCAAAANNVSAGAHPSYPDRENFGRISMVIGPEALTETLVKQMQALKVIAGRLGVPLTHVKPHGALYNDAAKSAALAGVLTSAIATVFGKELALIGQPGSETEIAASGMGLPFHREGFIDRAYMPDGSLMPRMQNGAVLSDTASLLAQARNIVLNKQVGLADGRTLDLDVETLCLHGDSPGAAETARAVHHALKAEGVILKAAQAE